MQSLNEQGQPEGKLKQALTAGLSKDRYDAFTDRLGLEKVQQKSKQEISKANSSGDRPIPPRSTRR